MAQIFINYRKTGGSYAAALLDELLSRRFGEKQVFRAARSIEVGSHFAESILRAVAGCGVMLVVVDAEWLEKFPADGCDPSSGLDWVVREIEEAFACERIVIPVLLSGAERLREEALPDALRRLAGLHYLRFDYRNVRQDSAYMAEQLVRVCPRVERRNRRSPRCGRLHALWSTCGRALRGG
ncbi:toll/interleukin-1 receptor domain-containing protein [Streptomyces pratensis]|uniref:toll/interleukin-1 receptor domain-containing protein n=1 Tax=Streptomyces pratensis TaxID=1169025 RepID=UPI003016E044